MTSNQFSRLARQVFGRKCGWQTRCAKKLGVDRASVSKWIAGINPIPGPVEAAMRCWSDKTKGACHADETR